jgi:5'-3' exonuclease
MGIKHLNRFLREEAQQCIKFISLAELSGKKIAVDISIYMYKYASEGTLLENMYLMLSTLRYYEIIPVFIFDGKPPPEKKELLQKRKEDKQEAEKEYNQLKKQLENKTIDDVEKQEVVNNMDILKKKFIHIGKNEIDSVKRLIRAYGATYYDAPGEADELCALLVIKNKVWACLSEDMDMFVYGCNRVLRYLSLLNKTVVLYDTKDILNSLGITQKELREICVISGTDYNYNENKTDDNSKKGSSLYKTLAYFKKYHKENSVLGFYEWLKENTDYIQDYENLLNIYNLFELNQEHTHLTIFENIKIINGPIMKEDIRNIIKIEGFIFPES